MNTKLKYKESKLLCAIIRHLYIFNNRPLRKIIRTHLLRDRKTEMHSYLLRELFIQYHGVNIGMYSYGAFLPDFVPGVVVGRYTSIASGLVVLNGSHPISHKSTHPFFFNPVFRYVDRLLIQRRTRLHIGNDVYIGANVMIMPSVVEIGDGAVIAAGSVVLSNVPPFAVVGGNPAHIIKYRFGPDTIKVILKDPWWSRDIDDLSNDESEFASFLRSME